MESNTATSTDLEAYVAGTTVQITKKKKTLESPSNTGFLFFESD